MSVAMRPDSDLHGRRRGRNLGVLIALLALVALLFAVTIVKLGPRGGNPTANPSAGGSWAMSLAEWLRADGAPGQATERAKE